MKSIDKIIKKELKKKGNKSKIIPNNLLYNVSVDMEFAKWLGYENKNIKERKKYLLSLSIEELNKKQIEELKEYNEEIIYSNLLNKYAYHLEECSDEEYTLCAIYINTHSIEELMKSKLSNDEIKYCNEVITKLFMNTNKSELNEYLMSFNTLYDINAYKNMSMLDSYIFHQLSKLLIQNNIISINDQINNSNNIKIYALNYQAN